MPLINLYSPNNCEITLTYSFKNNLFITYLFIKYVITDYKHFKNNKIKSIKKLSNVTNNNFHINMFTCIYQLMS